MRFHGLDSKPLYAVTVDNFQGGLNLEDTPGRIGDNQLSECINMWFRDNSLRTRPGFKYAGHSLIGDVGSNIKIQKTDTYIYSGSERANLCIAEHREETDGVSSIKALTPFFAEQGETKTLGKLSNFGEILSYIFFNYKGYIYSFFNSKSDSGEIQPHIYRCKTDGVWEEVPDEELYAPTIAINCRPGSTKIEGDMIYSYNMLSNRYKLSYDSADPDKEDTTLYLAIPTKLTKELVGQKYKVSIVTADEDTIVLEGIVEEQEGGAIKGVGTEYKKVYGYEYVKAYWRQNTDGESYIELTTFDKVESDNANAYQWSGAVHQTRENWQRNVIEVEVPYYDADSRKKICDNRLCTYFGGSASGISGGTRLFIAGGDMESGVLRWSDCNNPLYFPEDCCEPVGNLTDEPITALRQQEDMLVIFKSNELYYTKYNEGDISTISDAETQTVANLAEVSAYFPIVTIHTGIGCNCPDTIELCRNRLVWCTTEGKIYALCSASQYSECNVYELQGPIERRLKNENKESLINSFSLDYDGKYILFVGDRAYIMSYNSYGFIYIYSYYKTESADRNVPWHYFEFPVMPKGVAQFGSEFLIIDTLRAAYSTYLQCYSLTAEEDEVAERYNEETGKFDTTTKPIVSTVKTKVFDFGNYTNYKKITAAYIGLGTKADCVKLNVSFITERGETYARLFDVTDGSDESEASFIKNKKIFVSQPRVKRLGFCIVAEDRFALDHLVIKYKNLGVVK